jgi:hypothetical protein
MILILAKLLRPASWSGIMTGETGQKVNGGRGVSIRVESKDNNNVGFFGRKRHQFNFVH